MMDLNDFMNAICARAREGHPTEEITAQARSAGFPIERIRDEVSVSVSLANTVLDGADPIDGVDAETEAFIIEQRGAARQYDSLLLESYPKSSL